MTSCRLPFLLCACLVAVTALPLDFTEDKDDHAATVRLHRELDRMGVNTRKLKEHSTSVVVKTANYKICIAPVVSEQGTCLNGFIWFPGTSAANYRSGKLLAVLNKINTQFDFPTACVTKEGTLEIRYVLVFDQKVDTKALARWIDYMTTRTDAIMQLYDKQLSPFISDKPVETKEEPKKTDGGA